MDRFALKLLASVVVLASSAASAEPVLEGFVHTRVGRAVAPFHLDAIPIARSEITQAVSFVVGGRWRIRDNVVLGFRIPTAPSLVEQPGGSYIDDKTFGNPEISALRQGDPRSYRGVQLRGSAGLAIGVPIAGHGPNGLLTKNRALAISSAIEGWSNQALYVPSVIPITPAAALHARRRDALAHVSFGCGAAGAN